MYIPAINAFTEQPAIIRFMQQFSFATIITVENGVPLATHLPFVVSTDGDTVILTAHFAKANQQWKTIEHSPVLVIFSEPHAYISPTAYESDRNVPTWNYVSVHAYGEGTLITETNAVMDVLAATIASYEADYGQQWNGLPESYKTKMLNGIVAFKISVTDLQAKKKLSQNRTEGEQQRIIQKLEAGTSTNEKAIAGFMSGERTR